MPPARLFPVNNTAAHDEYDRPRVLVISHVSEYWCVDVVHAY